MTKERFCWGVYPKSKPTGKEGVLRMEVLRNGLMPIFATRREARLFASVADEAMTIKKVVVEWF
jgi:hypothetical protein